MLTFGVIAGLFLLYGFGSNLAEIASCLKDIRSSLNEIQHETVALSHRLEAIEEALEEGRHDIRNIASIAEEYDGVFLAPMRKAHSEAEFFRDI